MLPTYAISKVFYMHLHIEVLSFASSTFSDFFSHFKTSKLFHFQVFPICANGYGLGGLQTPSFWFFFSLFQATKLSNFQIIPYELAHGF
jgi:hypothetical protein